MRWQGKRATNIKEEQKESINFIPCNFDIPLAGMDFTLTFATLILIV